MIDNYNAWQVIEKFTGQTIKQIHRVVYIHHDKINWDNDKPIQFTSSDGSVLSLDGGGDGESFVAQMSAWVDPFEGKLSDKNIKFIQEYGKWTICDISGFPQFNSLIGKSIDQAFPIQTPGGKLSGVQFIIDETYLNIIIVWDECQVLWGNDDALFQERRVRVHYG